MTETHTPTGALPEAPWPGPQTDAAIAFPGMGPMDSAEVAKLLLLDPYARTLLGIADDVLGDLPVGSGGSVIDAYREGEGDYTVAAQVVFLVSCLAMAHWAERHLDARPAVCTAVSFGAKAAAVYSGALDLADAVLVTAEQARCEAEYFAAHHSDVVTHSFMRISPHLLAEVLGDLDAAGEPHEVSCYIDDGFYMISLREARLEWLERRLRVGGAMPLYTMRPPMHCAAFAPLRDQVAEQVLDRVRFTDPRLPVIADQDGSVRTTAEGVRRSILDGIVRPVRWPDVVCEMQSMGITKVYVAGPDAIIGRVGRTTRTFETVRLVPRLALQPRRRQVVSSNRAESLAQSTAGSANVSRLNDSSLKRTA